ncbi:histidine phosphatase family protein [Timonella sp. A28]|uniref:histidine phosphatase family protein n=1 Tax=Timonella sp. A28 TaxID=3442640 RepID=UPI003EB7EAFA
MKKRLYLIRHGQIDSNVTGALDTAVPGPPLNATGHTQAQALVDTFATTQLDTLYSSTAIRTQMTAAPLAASKGLTLNVHHGLREISAGTLEMSIRTQDHLAYVSVVTQWISGDLDVRLANGTTGREVLERFDAVLTEIDATGSEHTAITAHGALITFWCAVRMGNLTKEVLTGNPIPNTGVAVLEPVKKSWVGLSWMGIPL